jgi:DNA polymerase-3 subunit delta'
LGLRGFGDVFARADDLVQAAESEATNLSEGRDTAEREALETAMGAGGTGKGTAASTRGAKGALKELEKRQKSRATRTQRDSLDLALIDLAGFYRDVLVTSIGADAARYHPDRVDDLNAAAVAWTRESTLRRLESVLSCRKAIEENVKPRIAVEAMLTALYHG